MARARVNRNGAGPAKMAPVQRKWRGSSENGAGNKFRCASKKFRGAGNKFRDQLPSTYIQDSGYFDKNSAIIRSNIVSFCGNSASFKLKTNRHQLT
jgi:hypothetical protein